MRPTGIGTALLLSGLLARSADAAVLRTAPLLGPACHAARFRSIQSALDAAHDGDVIRICPGTYPEQILITKRVTLAGLGDVTVQPVAIVANTTNLRTGTAIAAIAVVTGRATLRGLTFDASQNGLHGCASPDLVGVFFRGVSGYLRDTRVDGIRLMPADWNCDTGTGVLAQSDGASPIRIELRQNTVEDYQRAGFVLNGAGVRATVIGNTIIGAGFKMPLPQNGVQVAYGAHARIVGNTISANIVPSGPDCALDTGALVFQAAGVRIAQNTLSGNTVGIAVLGSGGRVVSNTLDGHFKAIPEGISGIVVLGDHNRVQRNQVRSMSAVGIRLAGSGNLAVGNTVVDTQAAALCASDRLRDGCGDVLATCGVGLWLANDTRAAGNELKGNDTPRLESDPTTTAPANFVPVQ